MWGPRDQGVEVELIVDPSRAKQVLAELPATDGAVAFDLETAARPGRSALDPWTGYPRLTQFYSDGPTVYVLDLKALGDIGILQQLEQHPLVTFAGVFECKWLLAAGLEFPNLDDAALAAALHLHRDRARRADLVTLGRLHCDLTFPATANKKAMQLSDLAGELTTEQLAYAASDVVVTLRFWRSLTKARRAYDAARGAIVATARMELQGLPFDRQAHAWIADEWDQA